MELHENSEWGTAFAFASKKVLQNSIYAYESKKSSRSSNLKELLIGKNSIPVLLLNNFVLWKPTSVKMWPLKM